MALTKKTTLGIVLATLLVVAGLLFLFRNTIADKVFHRGEKQEAQLQIDAKRAVNEDKPSSDDSSQDKGTVNDPKAGGTTTTPAEQTSSRRIELSTNQASDNVVVVTKLYGFTDGNCTVTATSPAGNSSQSAQIVYGRDFSTCAGFSIPTAKLGKGTWTIKLDVTAAGTTTSKQSTLEVK